MHLWIFGFLVGVVFADVMHRIVRHVQPRRGVPSAIERSRLAQQREQALTQRVLEWQEWGAYVAGATWGESIPLPPMPGTPPAS